MSGAQGELEARLIDEEVASGGGGGTSHAQPQWRSRSVGDLRHPHERSAGTLRRPADAPPGWHRYTAMQFARSAASLAAPPQPPSSPAGGGEGGPAGELCSHEHYSNRAPWLRALVLGANDGLVSVSSLMMGVGAGSSDHRLLILSGTAGLVAGSLSMAVGEYISVSSQRDAEQADIDKERQEQLKGPEAQARELDELARIYVERGLPPQLARQVAEKLSEGDVVRAHARDELGIDVDNLARPLQAAVVSALCFVGGGGLPLLAAAFVPDWEARMLWVLGVSTLGLGLFGVLGAWLGGANLLVGGARVLIGGWLAMGLTYGIGTAFGVGL